MHTHFSSRFDIKISLAKSAALNNYGPAGLFQRSATLRMPAQEELDDAGESAARDGLGARPAGPEAAGRQDPGRRAPARAPGVRVRQVEQRHCAARAERAARVGRGRPAGLSAAGERQLGLQQLRGPERRRHRLGLARRGQSHL